MNRPLSFVAVVVLALGVASGASAQKIDANGKCHDAKGKMAPMSVCKPPTSAPNKCRDMKTKKFAKCGAPNTEPVPAK